MYRRNSNGADTPSNNNSYLYIFQTVICAFKIVLQYVKYLRRIKNQSLLTRVEICLLKSTPTDDCSRKRVSVNVYLSFCGFSTKNGCRLSAIRVYNFITCQCKRSFNNYNEYHIHITHFTYLNIAQLLFPLEIFVSDLRSLFFGNFNRCSVVNFCIISFYYVYDIRV